VENQNVNCADGNYGTIVQSRFATWSCPEAWDVPVQGAFSGWSTTSNTCTACPAPSTQSELQWVATPSSCAAAQYGNRSWEREQTRSRGVSYSCPAGTTTLPGPTYGAWSAWTNTGATRNQVNTCVNCPSPTTQTQNQWVATPSSCAAGQYGNRSWEREQSQSRSVSYNCPAGTTSLPPASYGSWSAWSDTGATRNQVNTCASCPAPSTQTQTQWVASSAACPAGYTGSHTWEREQSSSRSISYSCPAGTTTLPPATVGGWSAWADTGATRNVVNTCTAPPAASFVAGCDFYHNFHGRTGFEYPNCAWDPSAYWQDWATIQVGNMFDANGRPYLDNGLYRVEMTSSWDGANCSAAACVIYPNMATGDGRAFTRVRVYRRSDNALLFDQEVETDFSNL
jgi:hypothetical protein